MNKQAFLVQVSVEMETLDLWLENEWLAPARDADDLLFTEADAARGRLIRDLDSRFGVNAPGVDLILHLLDQLHGMRQAFEGLRDDLGRETR